MASLVLDVLRAMLAYLVADTLWFSDCKLCLVWSFLREEAEGGLKNV